MSVRYLGPRSRPLWLAGGLAVGAAGLDLALPWPLLLVVDNAIDRLPLGQPWATLLVPVAYSPFGVAVAAGIALMGLALASAVMSFLGSYLAGAGGEKIGGELRADLHSRFMSLAPGFHDQQRASDLASRLTNDVSRIQEALEAVATNVLRQTLTLVGTALVLLAINPALALACLVVVPPLAVVAADRRLKMRTAQLEQRDRQAEVTARVAEEMRNVRLVQAFAYEPHVERSFRARNLNVVRSGLRVADLNARHEPTAIIVVAAGAVLVLWIGAFNVLAGQMTKGVLFVVLWYVLALYDPVRSLTWLTSVLGRGLASWERVVEMLAGNETAPEDEAPVLPSPREAIVFRGVSFRYIPSQPVLRELNLRIPAGSTLCIVGPSGAGKSSLLSLIVRFYDPLEGNIEVDGADLGSFNLRSVRERIALIPQDPALFPGSLLENIALGRPNASQTELIEAARLAQLDDFAQGLPDGYHTQIGEGGAVLSAGQRRCVALARALVCQAPVLLLDDPTAGLDPELGARLIAAIRRAAGARTIVIVTQNLTAAIEADRVVALRDGRIVEATPPTQEALIPATSPLLYAT